MQLHRRPGPVEAQLRGVELGRVGRLAVLGHRRPEALTQGGHEQVRPDLDQAGPQLRGGLLGADGRRHPPVDGTGVEALLQGHEAAAGLGVAGQDRPLDGRRAAPARQQAEVDVDEAQRGQEVGPDQLPVGDDHAQLGAPGHGLEDVVGAVADGEPQLQRRGLHRRRRQRAPPAPALVGLGDDEQHLVARGDQRLQRRDGGLGRAEVDEPHRLLSAPAGSAPAWTVRWPRPEPEGPSPASARAGPAWPACAWARRDGR